MVAATQELLVKLTADASQAVREFKRAADATENVSQKFNAMGKTLKTGLAALGAGAISTVFVQGIRNAIDAMDELSKSSQKTGVAVESLAALGLAASQAGLSAEQMNTAVAKLNKQIGNMGDTAAQSTKILKALKIDPGADAYQSLKQIADVFQVMPDGAKKTALAIELFGKAGADLIPLLNGGAAGLENYEDKAKRLGIVLDKETVEAAERFNDSLDDVSTGIKGAVTQISAGMLPVLDKLAESLAETTNVASGWKTAGKIISDAFSGMVIIGGAFWQVLKDIGTVLGGVSAALSAFVSGEFKQSFTIISSIGPDLKKSGDDFNTWADSWANASAKVSAASKETAEEKQGAEARDKNLARGKAALDAMTASAEKTAKTVKQVSEPLTAVQQIVAELMATRDSKIIALEQLQFLTENSAALQAAGISIKEINDSIISLENAAGMGSAMADYANGLRAAAEEAKTLPDKLQYVETVMSDLRMAGMEGSEVFRVYADEAKRLRDEMGAIPAETTKAVEETNELATAVGSLLSNSISSIGDALFENTENWADWGANLLKEIAKVLVKLAMMQALIMALEASGYGSYVKMLGLAGGKKKGAAFNALGVEKFAKGGEFHNSILRNITPFAMGGTFRSLAVAGEAGPEAVVPLKRTSGGDLGVQASPVQITINNTVSDVAAVDVAESNREDGSKQITLTIRREMKAALSDGSMDSTMRGNYGLARRAVG